MESSSSRYMTGDNFIGPWGTLNFHLPLGGLAKWVFKFSTLFGGTTGFSLLVGWREPLNHTPPTPSHPPTH